MKSFRLIVHQKNFSEEDVIVTPKDYPELKEGDIVEIYHPHPEEENPRLLLQVKSFKDDLQTKDTISVEQSIATAFGLRTYKDVIVSIVNPANVALDSVELTFKDQYMGRSEMWRLKRNLTDTCVYINKKLEFCGGAVRCQVYEMWSLGDRVACGVITDDTNIVFRSSTSMVYLFLQMSSEMWDFDIHGDLYFEKAVNGFLADLFQKWKKNGSNHEVTIVLFSRTFYEAHSLEEFPEHMRECLQQDYNGRYYEDFYKVAVQNERYDDWSGILVQLRRLFSGYLKVVLEYHSRPDVLSIPAATNSTAAQGNFLEVLNMSLNVFEKHYLDRSFDRTGQLSVVITPGVGVFEVDRELTNVTKQRIIDNGVGSDLVCVGEQPLHAVPLLKFHNKDTHMNVPDDYSMPHWINLSFYSTNKKIAYSNFVPRIKLPPPQPCSMRHKQGSKGKLIQEDEYMHNTFFDYDAYDAQVFQLPSAHTSRQKTSVPAKKVSSNLLDPQDHLKTCRKLSDPDIRHATNSSAKSQAISIPLTGVSPISSPHLEKSCYMLLEKELSPPLRPVVGSAGSPPPIGMVSNEMRRSRALINPFDPSHVTIKLTSNRRRWTHIFPKGPSGVLIQQHHYQAVPAQSDFGYDESGDAPLDQPPSSAASNGIMGSSGISTAALLEYCKKRPNHQSPGHLGNNTPPKNPSKSLTLLWGATGEQEWTPALTTVNEVIIGVDWKSLTISACLPITTDYFPDKRALQTDYVVSLYNLLPDDVNADFAQQRANYRKPLSTVEVFKELISQRLAQGFQLILPPRANDGQQPFAMSQVTPTSGPLVRRPPMETEPSETFHLSIGRIFHKISLSGNAITVTRYRPRHPYPPFNIHYRYRFQAPYHDTYEVSWVSFTTEKLENYNWNYLDHYICTRGDTDFVLVDALKFWRFRVYLLPLNSATTKRIVDGSAHCDIYSLPNANDHNQIVEGFLKFIETVVNKIKRPTVSKKTRMSLSIPNPTTCSVQPRRYSMSSVSQKVENAVGCGSPFRERLGSNRLSDRPRPRSGSKVMDRGRHSPAVDTADNNQQHDSVEDATNIQAEPLLKATSTHVEILEALRNPLIGIVFTTPQQNLASSTFVAADAANFLISHMEGVTHIDKAVEMMELLRKEHLICHASGDWSKPFCFGFFLFYIVPNDKEEQDLVLGDLQSFENEWLEVEVRPPLNWGLNTSETSMDVPNSRHNREVGVPHFLCDDIDTAYLQGELDNDCPAFKKMHVDPDVSNKSDRVEWGHAGYQSVFRPDQAYEMVIEWLVSSGSIVSELLFGWHRKAQTCGLQMVPIPHDPLALPYSNKSDPLRGPIFVPLNTKCLVKKNRGLFQEFGEATWMDRLFLFQEAIVSRFGFIPCLGEPQNVRDDNTASQEHQYIHSTGTVFILVPSPIPRSRHRLTSVNQRRTGSRYPSHVDVAPSPHEAYITRHVGGKNKDDYDAAKKIGFLWSWNHMISRRWRTNQAVDSNFQIRLLKDFKAFCENADNRLLVYWEQSWEMKEDASSRPV